MPELATGAGPGDQSTIFDEGFDARDGTQHHVGDLAVSTLGDCTGGDPPAANFGLSSCQTFDSSGVVSTLSSAAVAVFGYGMIPVNPATMGPIEKSIFVSQGVIFGLN